MKKLFKTAILFFISATLLCVTACSKDDDKDKPATPKTTVTEKSKIIDREFLFTDYKYTVNGITIYTYDDYDLCVKDNITKYLNDMTGFQDEGATKCKPSDPQRFSFKWTLESNNTQLKMVVNTNVTLYAILINDGTTLKLESTMVYDYDNDGKDDTVVTTITNTKR